MIDENEGQEVGKAEEVEQTVESAPVVVHAESEMHTLLSEIEVELKKLEHEPVVLWAKFKELKAKF